MSMRSRIRNNVLPTLRRVLVSLAVAAGVSAATIGPAAAGSNLNHCRPRG